MCCRGKVVGTGFKFCCEVLNHAALIDAGRWRGKQARVCPPEITSSFAFVATQSSLLHFYGFPAFAASLA